VKPPVYDVNWSEETKAIYRHDIEEIWDSSINKHIWNQYHGQLQLYLDLAGFPELTGQKKILDVGCAQGTLALLLAERGHDVLALDLRPHFLDYAQTRYTHGRIRFLAGNALECELSERFDLIFANQVIEHLVYPEQLIEKLKGLLNSAGKVVVTTPNWHYIRNTLPSFNDIGDPGKLEHLQFTADGGGHFFAYKARELEDIFMAADLEIIESSFFESPFITGHLKIRYLHQLIPVSLLRLLDRLVLALPFGRYLALQLMIVAKAKQQ
jgi:2-polyprenyl-3-methyl-5-hydroxy-6-metoxy-1,4-benzoquinol methylase